MRKSSPMSTDMSTLLELQMQLRRAVLGGDTAEIVAAIQATGSIRRHEWGSTAITPLRRSAPHCKPPSR